MADITMAYTFLRRHAAELVAFAAVAQQGQLSSAARSLGLSQPGLSQRIRHLEESLDTKLFDRGHRGVTLTPAGADLIARIEPHLTVLAEAVLDFRRQKQMPNVLISVDYAFASFWIMPRLAALREIIHPVDISVLASQDPRGNKGMMPDLIVRMGQADGAATRLTRERVSAICSPDFLRRHAALNGPADLLRMPLLSLSGQGAWFDWTAWFRHFGLPRGAGPEPASFNTYDLVIQAAVSGHGVALGWHGLIDGKLESGELVRAVPEVAESDRGYFLSFGKEPPSAAARRVRDWMADTAARAGQGHE